MIIIIYSLLQYSCVLLTQSSTHKLYYTDHKIMIIGCAFTRRNSEKQQATSWKVRLALILSYLFLQKKVGKLSEY